MRREELPTWPLLLLLHRCQPSLLSASTAYVRCIQSCHFCSAYRLEFALSNLKAADASLPLHNNVHYSTGKYHFSCAKSTLFSEHCNYTEITTGNTSKKKKECNVCHLCLDLSFIWAIFSSFLLSCSQNQVLRRSFRNSQVDKWSYVVTPQSMRFKTLSSACYSSNCYRQQGCPVQI